MAAVILAAAAVQYFDDDGNPLAGGKLYFFSTGSDTPAPVYSDSDLTIEYSVPLELDSAGRVPESGLIYCADSPSLDLQIDDQNDVTIWGPAGPIVTLAPAI